MIIIILLHILCNNCSFITINNKFLWITWDILSSFTDSWTIVINIIVPLPLECVSKFAIACDFLNGWFCECTCDVVCQENNCVVVWLVLGEGCYCEACALLSHILVQSCSQANRLLKTINIKKGNVYNEMQFIFVICFYCSNYWRHFATLGFSE